MSSLAVSRRYARALFELSAEGVAVAEGLEKLAAVAGVREVQEALELPNLPADAKVAIVEKIADKLPAELKRLVALLCERGKAALLPEINELFEQMVRESKAEVVATVVVAAKPDAATMAKIESAVTEVAGGKVDLNIVEDKEIIGGMVVRIGDRQIDASVRGKLNALRRAIAA